jgi:hypothetical protein
MIPNLGETHDEWVEYNRLSSHHSPSNGAASPPLTEKAAPPNFPPLDGAAELPGGRAFPGWSAPLETGRGGSLSGVSKTDSGEQHVHLFSFAVASSEAAPESQIITHPPSRSPVMDRLIPQKAQNRSLSSAGDKQVENARQVERLLWDRGYRQPKAIVAILANGWHESRWNAGTVYREKNGTVSRGFFQLTNGALTIEGNVEQLTTKAPYKARIEKWYSDAKKHGWSAGEAAYWFARRVEICASRFWNERRETADRWWSLVQDEL